MIQYCVEPLWPRDGVLGLRPPRIEFRFFGQEAQFSLYVLTGGLKPYSFLFILLNKDFKTFKPLCF